MCPNDRGESHQGLRPFIIRPYVEGIQIFNTLKEFTMFVLKGFIWIEDEKLLTDS